MNIGFIGLGIMGSGMAGNLVDKGFDVVVWNRTAQRMGPLVERGAVAGSSPADVARQCDVVMICVSDTPDVQEVVAGTDGLLEGLHRGSLIVDHSTIESTRSG